jgi:hypothetical protein
MLSFKQFITESDIDTQLKKLGLKRTNKFNGIGKEIGGNIYCHKQYESQFPSDVLNKAKSFLPEDYNYNIVKFDPKTNIISFITSNDFDTNDEPSVDAVVNVKPDGTVKRQGNAGWIYHHKWQWVADDYKGFDVEKSKERSLKWSSLEGVDKARIGQRKHWDDNVVPRLTENDDFIEQKYGHGKCFAFAIAAHRFFKKDIILFRKNKSVIHCAIELSPNLYFDAYGKVTLENIENLFNAKLKVENMEDFDVEVMDMAGIDDSDVDEAYEECISMFRELK